MDTVEPERFAWAFVLVLALIGLMAAVLKRFAAGGGLSPVRPGMVGGGRIQVLESRFLDTKRKLVLIRCDGRDYLLLLSDGREQVLHMQAADVEVTHA